jgi:hypothetical protein
VRTAPRAGASDENRRPVRPRVLTWPYRCTGQGNYVVLFSPYGAMLSIPEPLFVVPME